MKRTTLTLLLTFMVCVAGLSQDATTAVKSSSADKNIVMFNSLNYGLSPQIMGVDLRKTFSLDGEWKAIVDQYETGYYNYRLQPNPDPQTFFADKSLKDDPRVLVEYDFDNDMSLPVPSDWNTRDDRLYYYEGTIWYRKHFDITPEQGKRYFLYFGAANYETIVAVNGVSVAKHTGGFTPFNFEVTHLLKEGQNTVIAKVDNKRRADGVPTVNSDWWNYGGITRSVRLVELPESYIRGWSVQLKKGTYDTIEGWVRMEGSVKGDQVKVEIPELNLSQALSVDENGLAVFEFKAKKGALKLWSPESPVSYDVRISSQAGEALTDRIGFRSIETDGCDLLLNGRKIFCRGISVHEESPYAENGRFDSEAEARKLLGWAKELGCNFVRLAHYPHNETMIKVAQDMGLMVWSEVPVYWTIHWDNSQTLENALNQLEENINRDRNRANIIIWSVSNETPRSPERLAFLTALVNRARELDPTRLVSAAMEKEYLNGSKTEATLCDELVEIADIMSFNQYIGWYDGYVDKCEKVNWSFDVKKPVFISEWGGGALYGNHGPATDRFTEEYQALLYEENIKMLERIPGLAGSTPWILKDFRSPRRQLKVIQNDYNRKGLVSEFGDRKQAFYILQEWHRKLEQEYK